jgi:uncharacterized protein
MTERSFDPLLLNVEAFAKQAHALDGQWPVASLTRLVEAAHPEASPGPGDSVTWQIRGESRPARSGPPEVWLHVAAATRLSLVCQRCLQPVATALAAHRSFRFVHGEAAAAELDADSEDDVLALSRSLDVSELVEDELLLSLPLVPRHDICPQPLRSPDDSVLSERENPFAALAALKRGGQRN